MSKVWYYVEGNERVGPLEQDQMENLIQELTLNEDSFVWTKGMDTWQRLEEVPELEEIRQNLGSTPLSQEMPGPESSIIPEPVFGEEVQESEQAPEDIHSIEMNLEQTHEHEQEQEHLKHQFSQTDSISDIPSLAPQPIEESLEDQVDWDGIDKNARVITLKIGPDRGVHEEEYGPFSLEQLKQAYHEKRINHKTLIFVPGMTNWNFLGDLPLFQAISGGLPPKIEETERRVAVRKPFLARIFFHDNENVYEGICRDISIGGMQILVSDFPGATGERVNMNVHPDNGDFHFTASGVIVRQLQGDQGFSLRFEALNYEAKEAIETYVNGV